MSFPYPQDRNRDRREKGEHAYKEARQTMTESEANLQRVGADVEQPSRKP